MIFTVTTKQLTFNFFRAPHGVGVEIKIFARSTRECAPPISIFVILTLCGGASASGDNDGLSRDITDRITTASF